MQNLLDIQNALRSAPDQQLMGLMQGSNPMVPQWAVASELNNRKEMRSEQTRQEGLGQPTVLEGLMGAAPAPTPQTNVAGMPQGAASGMAQSIAPKTNVAQNTGIASVAPNANAAAPAPVAKAASGGILKMGLGGDLDAQFILTDIPELGIRAGQFVKVSAETLEGLNNTLPEVMAKYGDKVASVQSYIDDGYRGLASAAREGDALIPTRVKRYIESPSYLPSPETMTAAPTSPQGVEVLDIAKNAPPATNTPKGVVTPGGLPTLGAAGDADMRGEASVVDTTSLTETQRRIKESDAERARAAFLKSLAPNNAQGQPGGILGAKYPEGKGSYSTSIVEALTNNDPYSGELSPSQTVSNQITLSNTLKREEMQQRQDAIKRQDMEDQEEFARESARGDALAALGEIDRSSEPALFRQIASIAGERQANALRADPAMFGDMPFNATSDEAAKKSVSTAGEPGTELAVAAKTDPMQMTDTEIRNASQGLIPYDMSMAADGAQDPKPIAEPNIETTTQDTKLSPAALEEYISRVNSKGQPGGTVLTLEQQMENAKAAIATEAENDPSILDKGLAAVSDLKDSVVSNATGEGGIVDASTEFYNQFIKGKGPKQVVADRNYAYMDAARNNPDTFVPEIVEDKPLTLGDILIAASGDKSEGVLTSAAKKVDDLAETLETDGVQSLPIVKNATAAGSELVDSIISGAGTASDFVTNNAGPVTGLIFDTVNPGTSIPPSVLKTIESGYDAVTGLFTSDAQETAVAAGVVLPTPAKIGDAYKEYGTTRTASNLAEAERKQATKNKQDAGGGIATVNPMANRASDSPSSYEQKLLDILDKREKSADQDKWLGLAEMGMRLMASSNPNMLSAIGEAGLGASQTFLGNKRKNEAQEMDVLSKLSALEARKQIADDANRTRLTAAGIAAGARSGKPAAGSYASVNSAITGIRAQISAIEGSMPATPPTDSRALEAYNKQITTLSSLREQEKQLMSTNPVVASIFANVDGSNTPAAVNLSK